ncbi:hypothetical protein CBS470a_013618, partial [Colletotrichum nupharicola]
MSSSSDSPETSSDEEDDYQGLKMSGTHSLGLNKNYVLSWRRLHAFREFIQNWKDGIIAAFDMDPRSFLPVWDETTPGVIRITVHRNIEGQRELVGFIVHKAKTGTVEIANFNANLSMDDLSIGGSTKRNNDKFAGVHGEGFKVAALVMVRSGIPVRIQSTSANWNFGFNGVNKDRFYCKISKPNTRNLDSETASLTQQTMGGTLRSDLVSYSSRDVTIQLSHPATGRGYRNPITADEFRGWTTVSLDLSNPDPDKMIRTQHGDLVLDERFAGQIYLKGFKVSAPTLGSKSYRFCYNFATGKLGRDRERMTSHDKEAETLANIWETAVAGDHGNLVQRYVELFSKDCVDIISAEKASRVLARRIWTWLRTSQPGGFYYSEGSDSKHDGGHQVDIILNDIKRQPRKLAKELWRLLVKYDCARTPQQERIRLFSSSQPVGNVDGYFGLNISRILKSVLAMDTALSGIQLQFVQGADTTIDLHFDPKKDLLEVAMNHIRDYVDVSPSKAIELRRQAREYIRQTPRGVQVSTTSKAGELQVHWLRNNYEMVSRNYLEKKVCNVKLHSLSTCETRREDLIINTEHLSSASLYDSRLDIEFEKDRYYEIRDSSQCYPDYIAWVHDVHDGSAGCVQERHLSVTKFSILRQEHLFRGGTKLNESAEIADLMPHFSSVQHMGEQTDAEVVMIKDITFAKALSTSFRVRYHPVFHTHSCVPTNVDGSSTTGDDGKKELSCRFARSVSDETVTVTPIIPKHLAREERPERKGFSSSSPVSVFDFTPNVLGPLEGFAEAGFNLFAAIGFDPEHSISWKPKIEPELKESFLDPLDIMDSITKSNFDPDFQVLQMPPGVFHPNVFERFSSTIFQLLEKGETVCVNISSLQSFGCARQRYLVNTVASRFPGLAVVPIKLAAHRTEDDEFTLITDLIKDLSFLNPRQTESSEE